MSEADATAIVLVAGIGVVFWIGKSGRIALPPETGVAIVVVAAAVAFRACFALGLGP